jgi:hypothetical protein
MGLPRLDRDQPLQQGGRVMLVRHHHGRVVDAGRLPGDLQDEGSLARSLRTGEQAELTPAQPATEVGVEQTEAGGDRR